ncbi:hypothetical protein PPRY_a2987 [Pseudoalteromonas prydzensis ACAM 620]|nr:hypothetical protein [Pseudoalteromonas prydzensis ACAM 620]
MLTENTERKSAKLRIKKPTISEIHYIITIKYNLLPYL